MVIRRIASVLGWVVLAVAGLLALYLVAGAIGGAIPVNRDRQAPATGITIFVETNGVHTGIIVPKLAAGIDWRRIVRPADLRDPRYAGYNHLSFGWGERGEHHSGQNWAPYPGADLLAGDGSRLTCWRMFLICSHRNDRRGGMI